MRNTSGDKPLGRRATSRARIREVSHKLGNSALSLILALSMVPAPSIAYALEGDEVPAEEQVVDAAPEQEQVTVEETTPTEEEGTSEEVVPAQEEQTTEDQKSEEQKSEDKTTADKKDDSIAKQVVEKIEKKKSGSREGAKTVQDILTPSVLTENLKKTTVALTFSGTGYQIKDGVLSANSPVSCTLSIKYDPYPASVSTIDPNSLTEEERAFLEEIAPSISPQISKPFSIVEGSEAYELGLGSSNTTAITLRYNFTISDTSAIYKVSDTEVKFSGSALTQTVTIKASNPDVSTIIIDKENPTIKAEVVKEKTLTAAAADKYADSTIDNNYDLSGGNAYVRVIASDDVGIKEASAAIKWSDSSKPNTPITLEKQDDGTYVGYLEIKPADMYNANGELLTGETVLYVKDTAGNPAYETGIENVTFTSETKKIEEALATVTANAITVAPAEGVTGPVTIGDSQYYDGNVVFTLADTVASSLDISANDSAISGSGKTYTLAAAADSKTNHDVTFTFTYKTPHDVSKSKTIGSSNKADLKFVTDTTTPTLTNVALANASEAQGSSAPYYYGNDSDGNPILPKLSVTLANISTLEGVTNPLTVTLVGEDGDGNSTETVIDGSWDQIAEGTCVFTPAANTITSSLDEAKPYTFKVSATNIFNKEFAGDHASESFVTDYDDPVIKAVFSGPGTKIEDLGGVYQNVAAFFNKEGSSKENEDIYKDLENIGAVTITVHDLALDPTTITINDDVFDGGVKNQVTDWQALPEGDKDYPGYTITIPYASRNGIEFYLGEGNCKTLTVTAQDKSGNTGEYSYNQDDKTELTGGAEGTDEVFTVDVTPVNFVGASLVDAAGYVATATDGKNINVYSAVSTDVKITVSDANFDADNTHVYDSISGELSNVSWTEESAGTWTTTVSITPTVDETNHNQGKRTLHKISLSANDLLCNQTTEVDLSNSFGYVAFDVWVPVVSVKYVDASDESKTISPVNTKGSVDFYDKAIKAIITAKDPYFDLDTAKSTVEGGPYSSNSGPLWTETSDGSGVWTAEVTYSENAYNTSSKLSVLAVDLASPSNKTPYEYVDDSASGATNFVVDLTDPVINVSLDNTSVGVYEGVDYFVGSDTMTATITVTDDFFDDNSNGEDVSIVTPKGEPLASWSKTSWTETSNGVWETTVTFDLTDVDKTQSFEVAVMDLAKREDSAKYQDYSFDGKAENFVLDNDQPTITVKFDKKPVNDTPLNETDYYAAKPTATITVKDRNFSPDNSPITRRGEISFGAWTQDGDTWTATVGFGENKVDVSQATSTLKVVTVDKAYLAAKKAGKADAIKAKHVDTWGYATGKRGSQDPTGATKFVVDMTAPFVTITVDEPIQNNVNGVDYYGTASNGKLPVTITVKDNNFDTSLDHSTVIPSELGTVKGSWKKVDDNTYSIKVLYSENTDGVKSTLKLNIVDLLYTAASSAKKSSVKGKHVTTYKYRDANVEGKTSNKFKGNVSDTATGFVLDLHAPEIENAKGSVNYSGIYKEGSGSGGYIEPQLFYKNSNAGVVLTMADNNKLAKAEIDSPFSFEGNAKISGIDKTKLTKVVSLLQPESASKRNELDRSIKVTIADYANHIRTWSISPTGTVKLVSESSPSSSGNTVFNDLVHASTHPERLVLDTTAPTLSWSADVKPGDFTSETKHVTLNVVELNWDYLRNGDPNQTVITVTKYAPNAGRGQSTETYTVATFSGSDPNWSKQITFDQDGHYVLNAKVTDPAGNTATIEQFNEFTIDKTKPVIDSITWDNNDVQNGRYYKAARTATITVTEHNWDDAKAASFITSNGSISSWSHNGDQHTATVTFSTDGDYNLSCQITDKAGNISDLRTEPEFTVDLQTPTITISQVNNETAYNDTIAPVLTFQDEKNFSDVFGDLGYSFELKGAKHGVVDLETVSEAIANGRVVTWADILHDIEYDDIYTLTAHLVDLAGNETSIIKDEDGKEYDNEDNLFTFSVNRFGSTFRLIGNKHLTDELKKAEEEETEAYLKNTDNNTVIVQEINVDGAKSEKCSVVVSHGLDSDNLESIDNAPKAEEELGTTGFYLDQSRDSYGWAEYTYSVYSGNFQEDGKYSVVVRSTDDAGNLNDSSNYNDPENVDEAAEVAVEFVMDTQDPIIENVNFVDGELHNARKDEYKNVTFSVMDNIAVTSVEVTIDDDEPIVVERAEIEENDGEISVPIQPKSFTKRTMKIVANDIAGRSEDLGVKDFRATTNLFELYWPWFIGGFAALTGGSGFAYAKKRRKEGDGGQAA